jgi:EF hand
MPNISHVVRCLGLLFVVSAATAQPPFRGPGPSWGEPSVEGFVARMMVFDVNHDGKLTRSEVTDERLLGLFDRADANHDGVVTKEELKALFTKESAGYGSGPGGWRGGPGGGGGPGMRPEPGQILPEMTQRMLNLTPQQKTSLDELQHDVDAKLDRLLTPAQKAQLKEMGQRGPGGFMQRRDGVGGPPPSQR